MLYNITLRSVCSLAGFCLAGVLGAEQCGGDHGALCGSDLAFGPACSVGLLKGMGLLHFRAASDPPTTTTHTKR